MIVDALLILGLHLIPKDIWMLVEPQGHVADQILHENRVLIGPLGHRFLIDSLEQRIHLAGATGFDPANQIFNPDELAGANLYGDLTPLIVGPILADGL